NPDHFPNEPADDEASAFTLSATALVTAINKTSFAVSTDDLRQALTGVFCERHQNNCSFIATDPHRLEKYTRTDVSCPAKDSFIVPKKPLNLLKSALPYNDAILEVSYNSNHLFVKHGGTELVCRLIDARFPDYKVVIPVDNPYKMNV